MIPKLRLKELPMSSTRCTPPRKQRNVKNIGPGGLLKGTTRCWESNLGPLSAKLHFSPLNISLASHCYCESIISWKVCERHTQKLPILPMRGPAVWSLLLPRVVLKSVVFYLTFVEGQLTGGLESVEGQYAGSRPRHQMRGMSPDTPTPTF